MHALFFSSHIDDFLWRSISCDSIFLNLPLHSTLDTLMKKMLSVLLAALLFSPSLYANQAQTPATQQTENREVLLYIKEMHCQLCVYLVNKELRAIEGVESTKADMKARQVKVVAAPNVTNAQLIEAVKKINYTAEVR